MNMSDEEKNGRMPKNIWRPYLEDNSNEVPGTKEASMAQGINSSDVQLPPTETREEARPLLTTTAGSSRTSLPGTSSAPIQQQNASHPEGMGEGSSQEHGSEAEEEPRNACTFYEETFRCAEYLEKLTRQNVNKPKHVCRQCSKCFPRNDHLQIHYRTHTGEKPYTCEVCHHKCAQKGHLTQHLMTHTDEKPFCCGYCKAKFKRNSSLQRHINKLHPKNRESESGAAK